MASHAAVTESNELLGELHAWVARAANLQQLTTALGDTLSTQAVTDVIVSWSTELLGTAYATVLLIDDDRRSVRFLRLEPVPDEVALLMAKIPPNAPSATADALMVESRSSTAVSPSTSTTIPTFGKPPRRLARGPWRISR